MKSMFYAPIRGTIALILTLLLSIAPAQADSLMPKPARPSSPESDYLLALSWQPSFCETKPQKPECKTQTEERFDATNFVLHGLWSQADGAEYCRVAPRIQQLDRSHWSDLPPIELSEKTKKELAIKMPGFRSGLHLHEWYKHGTCFNLPPEAYFQKAIALLDQINQSAVQQLFANNIGQNLSARQIRQAFDQAFGPGAGDRVQVQCDRDIDQARKTMVTELQVHLQGSFQGPVAIGPMLTQGAIVTAGCSLGEVDPAGFQP
jgi:ribonuclease T2